MIVAAAIIIAVIVVLSALTAIYYASAQHYKDSKYRAQYVLVTDIIAAIPETNSSLEDIIDDDLDNGWRRSAALYAQARTQGMADCLEAIEAMYVVGDEKNTVFASLRSAFENLAETLEDCYVTLSSPERDVTAAQEAAVEASMPILGSIRTLLMEGVDPEADWQESPYALVDRMQLDALELAAQELADAQ